MEVRGLGKGANAPVAGRRCTAVVTSGAVEVDVLTFQLGADGRVRSDGDVVFYNQPASPEGAVQLAGPGTVTISLASVPPWVETVTIAAAVSGDEPTVSLPQHIEVTLTTEVEQFRCSATGLTTERAAVLAEFYRRNGAWKLRNVSAGWEQGTPTLLRHHGVTVDEAPADASAIPSRQSDDGALSAPAPRPIPVPASAPVREPLPPPASGWAPPPVPAPLVPPLRVGSSSPPPPPPRRQRGKRYAWLAATVAALLVLAAILGRSPKPSQDAALTQAVVAPAVSSTAALSTSRSAAAAQALPSSAGPASPTPIAVQALSAPIAAAVVRNRQNAQESANALHALRVAGRAPKTGYSRAQFGDAWTDDAAVDGGHNGCDTRNDVLRRDLLHFTLRAGSHGCAVTAGTMTDPYTGRPLQLTAGRTTTIQIDHMVALSNAWQTGAAALSPQQRQNFANDPMNLQATASAVNQAKSDGDAATWLPPDKSYRCTYVARQVAVKQKYALWVTAAERQAISRVLTSCGATLATPLANPTPTSSRVPTSARPPAPPPPATTVRATPTVRATTAIPATPATTTSAEPVTTEKSTTEKTTPEQTTSEQTTMERSTTTATSTQDITAATTLEDDGTYYRSCAAARAAGAAPLHTGDPGYRTGLDRDGDGTACE